MNSPLRRRILSEAVTVKSAKIIWGHNNLERFRLKLLSESGIPDLKRKHSVLLWLTKLSLIGVFYTPEI